MSQEGETITRTPAFQSHNRKRAILKSKITMLLKEFHTKFSKELDSDQTHALIESSVGLIRGHLSSITHYDDQINELICEKGDIIDEACQNEIDNQSKYALDINNKVIMMKRVLADQPASAISPTHAKIHLPDLKCDLFNGEGSNPIEYHSFMSQFRNVVGLRENLSDSTKLTYLKSFLRGYASKIVQHLQITDENYEIALDLLKNEFLNEDAVVDNLFSKLIDSKPKFDSSFLETKIFINDIRCLICDLKIYNIDLISEHSASKFISHVVFKKLPQIFQQELARKLGSNYPSIQEIFDNYVEIVQMLNLRNF